MVFTCATKIEAVTPHFFKPGTNNNNVMSFPVKNVPEGGRRITLHFIATENVNKICNAVSTIDGK